MLSSHRILQAPLEPKTVATNCRRGSPIEAAKNEELRPSRLSNVLFTILLAATLFFTTVALAPKLAHAQSASLEGSRTTVNTCTPGTRFDGYGTQFIVQVPDKSLQNLQSSSYIASLLNLAMMNVIEYCNKQAGNTPITQSSRFFAGISTQSDGVVNARKDLGQDTWTILQNDTAIALQRSQQRTAQAQAQSQAQQNAQRHEESDRQYAAQLRAKLTASVPAMPKQITENVACRIAMADLVKLPPPLERTNYCPYGHSAHFSGCTDYLSNAAEGWAQLSIPYSFTGCYGETVNAVAKYKFRHFDQGWKMSR